MNIKRVNILRQGAQCTGPVVYWMSRDQRVHDNWALIYAQKLALERRAPLAVIFCLVPSFLNAALRQYAFMVKGLQQVETTLALKNIPFFLVTGYPEDTIPKFIRKQKAGVLVTDFDPLRIKRRWIESVTKNITITSYEVDARNIVPCWYVSSKQEYAAYTFRPKIRHALHHFMEPFPPIKSHPIPLGRKKHATDWQKVFNTLQIDQSVPEVYWVTPGEKAGRKALDAFLKKKLPSYDVLKNDPTRDGQSNLSPYLHFGQISAQRVALEIKSANVSVTAKNAFLEELIVRRELSDNFCFFNEHYDRFAGFPEWAQKTLNRHRKDRRKYIYTLREFKNALTHDELWNAAQREMVQTGKMHGYMRMYWAKKILEWTESPEQALQIAIYLNDSYELDGRDTNGYTGISWSIGGVHDRAWNERPIFGKIRFMSSSGCKSKFNVKQYIQKFLHS